MKYKIGDKVKVIKDSEHCAPKDCTGKKGLITEYSFEKQDFYRVKIKDTHDSIFNEWWFSEDEINKIAEEGVSKNTLPKNFSGIAWFHNGDITASLSASGTLSQFTEPSQKIELPDKINFTETNTQKQKNKLLKDTINKVLDYLKQNERSDKE